MAESRSAESVLHYRRLSASAKYFWVGFVNFVFGVTGFFQK
jgi:hypothetical protein